MLFNIKHLGELVNQPNVKPFTVERIIAGYEKLNSKATNRTGQQGRLDFLDTGNNTFYLYDIIVNPLYRQSGVAREMYIELLRQAFNRTKGNEITITAYIKSDNDPMLTAVKKWGFKNFGSDCYTNSQVKIKREDFEAYNERIRR